jgi:outer membrane protein assembly factor BamB
MSLPDQTAGAAHVSRGKLIATVLLCLLAVTALALIMARSRGPSQQMAPRNPGADRPAGAAVSDEQSPVLRGKLTPGNATVPAQFTGSWPNFRGPNLDMIYPGKEPLLREWASAGPKVLWSGSFGEGHAGVAVHKGQVFLLDYDKPAQGDVLRCLSLADGKELWNYFYPVKTKRNHGMSRTVPAVDPTGKYVVTLGPKNHVICLETATGKFVWGLDLVKDFGSTVPEWYAGQCPLIDGDRVILAPGGDCLLMAVELASGKILWRSPNPRDWKMTHTSITPMQFAGKKFYIYSASLGVVGVDTEGQMLWESEKWKVSIAACASPVVVGKDRIFFSGGYKSGSMMAQLKEKDGKIELEELWRLKDAQFGSTQQTPILYQDHLYGVRPNGEFTCLNLDGKIMWTSTAADRFGSQGMGPYLLANGLLIILAEDGRMALVEANPNAYRRLANAQVLHGPDACAPMAMADGRLICRDLTTLVCLDMVGGGK